MFERHVGSLPQPERRQVRSQNPYRAAEIYLSGLMGSNGLHAAAVSDRSGLPLLGVGTKAELEFLSLWSVLDEEGKKRYRPVLDDICKHAGINSGISTFYDDELLVTFVISAPVVSDIMVSDLKRILAPLRAQSLV
jgi:hypothetical protein